MGPEVLTGSFRIKAGTATKLAPNTISTTVMIRTSRVYEDQMVALRAANDKLRDRAARIVANLVPCLRNEAFELLERAEGDTRVAIVIARNNCSAAIARQALAEAGGSLSAVIDS